MGRVRFVPVVCGTNVPGALLDTSAMDDREHKSEIVRRSIVTLPFKLRCVAAVATLLGVESNPAPFQLPDGEVHQLAIPMGGDSQVVTLTLWPTIQRVDAISASAAVVFTNVVSVDLVEGVEVLFRRSSKEFLIITVAGKVIVRS